MKHNDHNHRLLKVIGLTAVLGFALIGLSQCRFVNDQITGVDLKGASGLSAKSDCVRSCNEFYKEALEQENVRHKLAKDACGRDRACKDAEEALHKDNKSRIRDIKSECKGGCYNEGGGTAGQ